jgi:hypothetical protein
MAGNKLIFRTTEQKEIDEEGKSSAWGIPICGGNLSTPVLDQAYYIGEIHYRIGARLYIENAD